MARTRAAVRGRDQELAVLRAALTAEEGRLVVLKGPPGIGRTTLLEETERMLRASGIQVLPMRLGPGPDGLDDSDDSDDSDGPDNPDNPDNPDDPEDDAFALAPLVRAVRDRFEQLQGPGLADSLSTAARLSDAAGQETGGWVPSMITAVGDLFARIGGRGRTAVLADDAHAVAEPAPLLTAARRSGCLVLATCAEETEHADHTPGLVELLAAADQVLTLGPLADEDAEALVRRTTGPRLDEAVPDLLRTALGPLFGNPGTVLSTLADLRERGRMTLFRGRLCLRAPSEPIELPADHPLLLRVAALGEPARQLLSSVALWQGIGVDDLPLLAEATGTDLGDCGRVLDQLIDAQVLEADPAGRVHCRCPALAAAAVGPSGAERGLALHASVAERLLARLRQPGVVDPAVLADHLARSGTSVTLEPHLVGRLLELAAGAEAEEPERAARWSAAALRRLPPSAPAHARALTMLVKLAVRTDQYELLQEVLTRYAEQGCAHDSRAEVRLAAVLVALHTGEPPAEEAVWSLLDEWLTGREPIGFAQWWFGRPAKPGTTHASERPTGSPELISADRLELLSAALAGDPAACEAAWRRSGRAMPSPDLVQLHCAASVVDMTTVTRVALGDCYRVPATGLPAVYRRVVHGYAAADWSQALSTVRELELAYPAETLAHHASRLFAADICAARGEPRQAAQWLADAAPMPRLAVLRAWVRIGLHSRAGDDRRAVRLALRVARRLRRSGPHAGLHLMLLRAVQIAAFADAHDCAARLLAEIELLHGRTGTDVQESLLLARGLVHRDIGQAASAAELTRERQDLPSLLDTCLVIARFAEDPRPWLREAHGLATRCGASVLLERVRAVTRERGVPAPRARGRRDASAVTEARIVELIGEGLTNRQIALRLQVSEKTVENHLTRLFARTGYRSRVELASASLGGWLPQAVT